MTAYRLDADRSRLLVRTRAEGLLARLAHDLELELGGVDATLEGEASLERARGEVFVPATGVRVLGVLKGGVVDERVLSSADRAEILDRVRDEVFRGESLVVGVEARGTDAELVVGVGTQRPGRLRVRVNADAADGRVVVRFRASFSLRTMGVGALKGPMGAFRVSDEIELDVDALFVPVLSSAAQPA